MCICRLLLMPLFCHLERELFFIEFTRYKRNCMVKLHLRGCTTSLFVGGGTSIFHLSFCPCHNFILPSCCAFIAPISLVNDFKGSFVSRKPRHWLAENIHKFLTRENFIIVGLHSIQGSLLCKALLKIFVGLYFL